MTNWLVLLIEQFTAQSWLEVIAVVFALAYVWLAARQNIWCWPSALVSTAIYTFLFWEVSLPFHTLLNGYYLLMAIYGWQQWQKQKVNAVAIRNWPLSLHVGWMIVLSLLSVGMSIGASTFFDGEYLYLDAFITVFSVFTTVLVAHKVRENWLYWFVIDAAAVYLYLAKGLVLTGLLFVLYLVFAIYGYVQWGKSKTHVENNLSEAR